MPPPPGGREIRPPVPFQATRADGTVARGAWLAPAERKAPAPAVVFPLHASISGSLDGIAGFLVANGYAVVLAEFQGFADGGTFGNWGEEIAALRDTVEEAVGSGIVDSSRMCIAGWDRAAYIGLIAVTEHPSLFKCAISIGGVTDVRPYGESPETTPSPIELADRFDVPVLILHGRNDEWYPFQQSRAFHRALENAGATSELVLYDDAAHAIPRPADREDLYARVAAFLASHLGQ
jgi:dipeptidyl aminopeptidase/acylaminoacyl peptidase